MIKKIVSGSKLTLGTKVTDRAGDFHGVTECLGIDSSGRLMVIMKEFDPELENIVKEIYDYYIKGELVYSDRVDKAKLNLMKRIASKMKIGEEKALDNVSLIDFAMSDGSFEGIEDLGKHADMAHAPKTYLCPFEQISIDEKADIAHGIINDPDTLKFIGSNIDALKAGLSCVIHPGINPIGICYRCGKLMCKDCSMMTFDKQYYADCDKDEFEFFIGIASEGVARDMIYQVFAVTNKRIFLVPISTVSGKNAVLSLLLGGAPLMNMYTKWKRSQAKEELHRILFDFNLTEAIKDNDRGFIALISSLNDMAFKWTPKGLKSLHGGILTFKYMDKERTLGFEDEEDRISLINTFS